MTQTTEAPQGALLDGRQLSMLDVDVLTACLHHRLLSTDQLHALLASRASRRWVQMTTRRLADGGLLDKVSDRDGRRPPRPRLIWYVTAAGRNVVQGLVRERRHTMTAERAANALQRHTLLANDVGISFARHGERLGHHCGPYDWDHEVGHRYGHSPRNRTVVPDLVVRCWLRHADGDSLLTRFVEIDRGRYGPTVLRNKIRAYAELLTYTVPVPAGAPTPKPTWTREYPVFPKLLIVLADQSPAVIERRIDVLAELCRTDPVIRRHLPTLWLGCAAIGDVLDAGPYAPIWRTPLDAGPVDLLGQPPAAPTEPETAHRSPSRGRGEPGGSVRPVS